MVYHATAQVPAGCPTACDVPLLPLGGGGSGLADIVDEALTYFRANVCSFPSPFLFMLGTLYGQTTVVSSAAVVRQVLFRSFDIAGGADKLLLYLTLFISACLQRTWAQEVGQHGQAWRVRGSGAQAEQAPLLPERQRPRPNSLLGCARRAGRGAP